MAKVSFQFHADPAELRRLAVQWAEQFQLGLAIERFFPKRQHVVLSGFDVESAVMKLGGQVDRIWFRTSAGVFPNEGDALAFRGRTDFLALTIGGLTLDGLRESALGAMTEDSKSLKAWRDVVRKARTSMLSGAKIVNQDSGEGGHDKHHRYTEGALALERSGVKMLAFAGSNRFILDA